MRSILLICGLLLAASTTVRAQTDSDVHEIIDRHNRNIEKAYASADIDALVKHFAEDAWQMPPNSAPLVGREAIRDFWIQAVQWGSWKFELEAQDVTASGPMAVELGRYVLTFTAGPDAPPNMNSFQDRGHYLVHWRHDPDGEWRIVADAPVSELPLPGVESTGD